MDNKLPNWLIDRLPEYEKVYSVPQTFCDSTHLLWRLQGPSLDDLDQKNHFLKLCSNTESPFWQIMQRLFDFNLRTEITNFAHTYAFINKRCSFAIPELIKAETLENNNAYILTSELEGSAIESADLANSDEMIKQLANHLAMLHSNPINSWGSINKPVFTSLDWSYRLKTTLVESANKWGGVLLNSDKYLIKALDACDLIEITEFVPMMPDLRWDQFLHNGNDITALIDLDAFVFAPRELDFVILEYILTSDQIRLFSNSYSKHHAIPDIAQMRPAYRLLLFYMQILGETDLDGWMKKEALF